MKISVVATLYQSALYLDEFHRRISSSALKLANEDYEIIFVNDGSPDNSLEVAVKLSLEDPHVKVIDLSRNFGHHKAMMTGIMHAIGDRVFLIDVDLEEEPEWLCIFGDEMALKSCDVVYGIQSNRKGNFFEKISGAWFYKFFNALTGIELPENVVTARLMSRRYVASLIKHQQREIFIAGLWHITGFDQQPYTVIKHSTSASTYTLRKKLAMLVNSVTSFSNLPLIFIFYFGLFILSVSVLYIFLLIFQWAFLSRPLSGWTSVIASIWLLGGMIISFTGIIGIYLSKIFSESKQRPYTIVRDIYSRSSSR